MWFLRSSTGTYHFLWDKNSYKVGRKNADIIITGDDSISRQHAAFELQADIIELIDTGSKYGTFINGRKVEQHSKESLYPNTEIRFGTLQSVFKLDKLKIKAATSNVSVEDKNELFKYFAFLKGSITSWNKTCTHLVVSNLILTAKVLCALTIGQPIVNVSYFRDFVKSVKNNIPPPNEKDYLPEHNEIIINKTMKFEYNKARRTLFKGKTFVFLTEKTKKLMEELIILTGGKVLAWENNQIDQDKLNSTEYVFIAETAQDESATTQYFESYDKAINNLSNFGKRLILLQEIALAIVYCSCEENCNPSFNTCEQLSKEREQNEARETNTTDLGASFSQKSCSKTASDVQIEVLPSYKTELTVSKNNTLKRTLETESETNISKIIKTDVLESTDSTIIQSCTSSIFKRGLESGADTSTPKRLKDEQNSCSFEFSLRRGNKKSKKPNVFSFPECSESVEEIDHTDTLSVQNPFSLKRKTNVELQKASIMTSLENISNVSKEQIKCEVSSSENNSNSVRKVTDIFNNLYWITNTTTIKNEKIKESQNEEIANWNESFKNAIVVEYKELVVRKSNRNVTASSITEVNFKKFKKVHPLHVQTEIIGPAQMKLYIVGQHDFSYLDDETNNNKIDGEEFDVSNLNKQPQQKGRRKYHVK